jgi:hypothetical protein
MRLAVNQICRWPAAENRRSDSAACFSGAAWAKHRDALTLRDGERKAHRQMLVKPGHIIQF